MTGATIGDASDGELSFVFVFMARDAFEMHAGILHRQCCRIIGAHVTFFARNTCVPALQRKTCLLVREEKFLPRFHAVAGFTSIGHLFCELPFMDILVTGRALQRSLPMKLPRTLGIHLLSTVACNTGNRSVRTEQRKACLFVIVYGKTHTEKISFRVARFASSSVGAFGKLSRMRIGMAIGTRLKFGNMKPEFSARILPFVVILMAVFTFQYGMFPFQGELCRVMLENSFGDCMKIFRCMARCTLLFEFPLMRVVVTRTAGRKFHVGVSDSLIVIES